MLFQNVQQGAAVDIVVFNAVNGNVGAFGTFVASAQAGQFNFAVQIVFVEKTLDKLEIFGVAACKAGASHANFYRRSHSPSSVC